MAHLAHLVQHAYENYLYLIKHNPNVYILAVSRPASPEPIFVFYLPEGYKNPERKNLECNISDCNYLERNISNCNYPECDDPEK